MIIENLKILPALRNINRLEKNTFKSFWKVCIIVLECLCILLLKLWE